MVACNYGGGGGTPTPTVPELLWTNPNPGSAFSEQTVTLNLSQYKSVAIEYRGAYNKNYSGMVFLTVPFTPFTSAGNTWQQLCINTTTGNNPSPRYCYGRKVTVTTSGITFSTGQYQTTASNNYAIPLRIFGIKAQIYPDNWTPPY